VRFGRAAKNLNCQNAWLTVKAVKLNFMNTNIGIADKNRKAVATELAKLLADEFLLYTKTRNAHWNVEGDDFHSMHVFFESQYDQLAETVDSVAERIRQLGHYAPATLKEFLELTHLSEESRAKNDSQGFIRELLADHESVIIFLRENVNRFTDDFKDTGTSDFITGLMEEHEKMAWMLRSHLA
jgi:starvation-inducible DNA-binding protein